MERKQNKSVVESGQLKCPLPSVFSEGPFMGCRVGCQDRRFRNCRYSVHLAVWGRWNRCRSQVVVDWPPVRGCCYPGGGRMRWRPWPTRQLVKPKNNTIIRSWSTYVYPHIKLSQLFNIYGLIPVTQTLQVVQVWKN